LKVLKQPAFRDYPEKILTKINPVLPVFPMPWDMPARLEPPECGAHMDCFSQYNLAGFSSLKLTWLRKSGNLIFILCSADKLKTSPIMDLPDTI